MKTCTLLLLLLSFCSRSYAQDTIPVTSSPDSAIMVIDSPAAIVDTPLRIINLSPFVSLHVDSVLSYKLELNKTAGNYFWYLKNAPAGMRLNRENGLLTYRPERSYFVTGKLKYDIPYSVQLGVHDISDPSKRNDTAFTIVFFNNEIIPSRIKSTVNGTILVDEGEAVSFGLVCETGTSPIEYIQTLTSIPIGDFKPAIKCNDAFSWTPPYDFVKETDTGRIKKVIVLFVGITALKQRDTFQVAMIVRNALNYPLARQQYERVVEEMNLYIRQMKYTFLVLDKGIKKTKKSRTIFDLTSSATALTGTIMATSKDEGTKKTGTIMPGIGVALTPIKEATAPTKTAEQNQATLLRSSIKRLTYILQDNKLEGEKDIEIAQKTAKLKEELKQSQLQLIDVPLEMAPALSEKELDQYFYNPKVNKKYRLNIRKR